ncbi:MAG: SidA/IucD/PvdA family monooxygenase [Micromonosporaceae bacterium]|nr:SidA/IucD/PvdA family monooxygenase [Micromonosporaceae bacterium]
MIDVTRQPASVLIVGTGFSGLALAIQLAKDGVDDFVVLEKAADVGGTWRENTYPGCACDVQSHLYSYSFEPNPRWSRMFAPQQEIADYLRSCVEKHGLRRHIRFNTEFASAEYDDETDLWRVETGDGGLITANAVVLAQGPLHQPLHPDVPGMERFEGRAFHSAEWDHDCDLTGKRVAVIGTGASAIQFVPAIADQVAELTLVQRTPAWVMPKLDRAIRPTEQRLYRALPILQRLYRHSIYWRNELRVLGMLHPRAMKAFELIGRQHIKRHVKDPELARALTPDFAVGCKRILISNDYYPALARENVRVVTHGLKEVTERGVVTADGAEHEADVIIYGTGCSGFENLRITGRDGVKIQDAWSEGPEAYLGATVAGFPNLFLMLGPNTGLGHSSMVFMAEAQTRYITQALKLLEGAGARSLEVRTGVQARFNDAVQQRLSHAVWAKGGCTSWYVDADGKNRTLWPSYTFSYWWRTRRLKPADYTLSY